jgi:hypothetical protein
MKTARLSSRWAARINPAVRVALALTVLAVVAATPARAGFVNTLDSSGAFNFAVVGQFGDHQTNFNNGTVTDEIGIGSLGQFTLSNASMAGNIRSSRAGDPSGLTPNLDSGSATNPLTISRGGTVSGNVVANESVVMIGGNDTMDSGSPSGRRTNYTPPHGPPPGAGGLDEPIYNITRGEPHTITVSMSDDVTAAPAPPTFIIALSGIACLGLYRRRNNAMRGLSRAA